MEMQYVHSYGKAVNPKQKDIGLVADSIPKCMKMKDLNSRVKGGTKAIQSQYMTNQLNLETFMTKK